MAARRCPVFRKLKWRSYPGGAYAPISKARARFVAGRAFSPRKTGRNVTLGLPRPGYEMQICPGMRLVNRSGRFELDRAWHGFRKRRD